MASVSPLVLDDKTVVPDKNLYGFLSEFRAKLPREIRDMIYEYLLDEPTSTDMMRLGKLRVRALDSNEKPENSGTLRFLNGALSPGSVPGEIVEAFFHTYGFEISLQSDVNDQLNRDIFGCNVAISDVHIPRLKVDCPLSGCPVSQLTTQFGVLSSTVKAMKDFHITFNLILEYNRRKGDFSFVETVVPTVQALAPFLSSFDHFSLFLMFGFRNVDASCTIITSDIYDLSNDMDIPADMESTIERKSRLARLGYRMIHMFKI